MRHYYTVLTHTMVWIYAVFCGTNRQDACYRPPIAIVGDVGHRARQLSTAQIEPMDIHKASKVTYRLIAHPLQAHGCMSVKHPSAVV